MPIIHNKVRLIIIIISLVVCLITVAISLFVPAGNRLSQLQIKQWQSNEQLREILQGVLDYKRDHDGKLPESLVELVSYANGYLKVFYAPARLDTAQPSGWETNKDILDKYADYSLSQKPNSGVLVFENPGLWPDVSVAVGFSDGSVKRLSASEFTALGVKQKTPSALPRTERPGGTDGGTLNRGVKSK